MRLARKLIAALVVGIFTVMACNAYLRLRNQTTFLMADSERDLRATARAIASGIAAVMATDGEDRGPDFVAHVNLLREEIDLRWVWIDELGVSDAPPGLSRARVAALQRGEDVTFVREIGGDTRRFMFFPLTDTGSRPAAIELSESLGPERSFMRTSQLTTLATALVVALVCALLAIVVGVVFVGRPMRLLSEKARRVGAGDLSGPLILRQRDEIGELATEINAMCDRLAAAQQKAREETEARIGAIEQLRHADRLRTVGQLASGVAHELGTPLNVVSGHASLIRSGEPTAAEVVASAEVIHEQARRMTSIIRQLLDFSRRTGTDLADTDLRQVAAGTLEMLGPLAEKRAVTLRLTRGDDDATVRADWNQIQQAVTNLVVNAIQATPYGGTVELAVRRAAARSQDAFGDAVLLLVRDSGHGIPPDDLPQVFEPFFTTKDVGEGTGLGLAVAYGIVREHGGRIEVESAPSKGSRFTIVLPAAAAREPQRRKVTA